MDKSYNWANSKSVSGKPKKPGVDMSGNKDRKAVVTRRAKVPVPLAKFSIQKDGE